MLERLGQRVVGRPVLHEDLIEHEMIAADQKGRLEVQLVDVEEESMRDVVVVPNEELQDFQNEREMQLDALGEAVFQASVQRGAENTETELLGEKAMHVGVDRRGEQTDEEDRRIRLEDRSQQRFGFVERGAFQHEQHRIHDFLIRPRCEFRLQTLHRVARQQRAARQRRKTLRWSRDDPSKQR